MKNEIRIIRKLVYISEVVSEVESERESDAATLAWADEHPDSYKLVMGTASRVYGRNSPYQLGLYHGSSTPEAVIHRLERLRDDVESMNLFFRRRAMFSFDHARDPKLTGGLFCQHAVYTDGKEYGRSCTYLDYTPSTRDEVIERFMTWMETGLGPTVRITVDDDTVRTFSLPEQKSPAKAKLRKK